MKLQLSISVLVSDRRNTLGRCLNSLLPLLRELDSELIIVYTGKEEQTLEIAKRYTDRIVPFEWCDDFAKARNAGLERARGEWFLYLDDDEWFENVEEILQFFKSGEYLNYNSASYLVRNYMDWEGEKYVDASVGRMVRRLPDTRFEFPIHECLVPFEHPNKKLHAFVHHYGYVKVGRETSRFERNVPLLLQGLKENPKSSHFCMQLAQEYRNGREYEKAVYYCRKGLMLAQNEKTVFLSELWMMVNLPVFLSLDGKSKQALKEAEKLLRSPRMTDLVSVYLYIILVNVCCDLKEYWKGIEYVQRYHTAMEYLHEHPESIEGQSTSELSLPDLRKKENSLYMNALICAMELDEKEMVCKILSWIPWEDELDIKGYYPHLEQWKERYKEEQEFIQEAYYGLESSESYLDWQKTLYAETHLNVVATEKLWIACAKDYIPELLPQMIEMAVRNSFSLSPLLDQLSLEIWCSCCAGLVEEISTEEMEDFWGKISLQLEEYPLYAYELRRVFLEKQLSQGLLEQSVMLGKLSEYCEITLNLAHALYREEYFTMPPSVNLPSRCRFVIMMQEALSEIEKMNLTDSIRIMKEALYIYPRMSVLVRHLLMYVKEQLEHPKVNVSSEFISLGEQVKQKIRELMEQKQWTEAYALALRLVSIVPDDFETIRLKQRILAESVSASK